MITPLLISKQPVLNANDGVEANIFYHTSYIHDDPKQWSEAFSRLIFTTGLTKLTEGKPGIFKLDASLLFDDSIESYPAELFIIGIEEEQCDDTTLKRIEKLKSLQLRFALFHTRPEPLDDERLKRTLPLMDYYIVDAASVTPEQMTKIIPTVRPYPLMLVGANVHEQEQKAALQSIGIEHFSGAFFTQISGEPNHTIETAYLDLLNLLNILEQSDSIDEIAKNFAKHPEITFQLLQFLNSPAFGLTRSIKSVRHALLLIGRKELRQWLLIMAFSTASKEGSPNSPLLHTANTRVSMLNYLTEQIEGMSDVMKSEAIFVAILSLLKPLLGITHQKLFETITVDKEIREAVTECKGQLGQLLELCIASEKFDKERVQTLLNALELNQKLFEEASLYGYQQH